ncbi:MAG: hypothetical protein DRN95_03050 [Candidatus Hydrothermarchaeota archaeon]|nr:MAG: hypothetical protein DRN95_03050 [Candidatus Hydrothermarchaeota archaeon]
MRAYSTYLGGIYALLGILEIINWQKNFTQILPANIFSGFALLIVGLVLLKAIYEEEFIHGGAVLSTIFLGLFGVLLFTDALGSIIAKEPWEWAINLKLLAPWLLALPLLSYTKKFQGSTP